MDTTTTTHHQWIEEQRAAMIDRMASIESRQRHCEIISDILARNPQVESSGRFLDCSDTLMVYLHPESLADIATVMREIRHENDCPMPADPSPDSDSIFYLGYGKLGNVMVRAFLQKKCTFKKVGEETVVKPIYQVTCE